MTDRPPDDPAAVRSLDAAVTGWARRTPDALAITGHDRSLSYRELDRRADQLAHYLFAAGVREGSAVGTLLPRSAEFVVTILAIVKLGAHYVPLTPELPKSRVRTMLDENDVRVLVACRSMLRPGVRDVERIVLLDEEAPRVEQESTARFAVAPNPERAVYVLYTSGTTGSPKGIAIPHRGVLRLGVQPDYIDVRPGDRFLLHSSLLFDLSTFEIWVPLLNGATVVVAGAQQPTLTQLARDIEDHGVTTAWFTTSLFNQLVLRRADALGRLRTLVFGGEAAAPDLVREAAKMYPDTRLVNGYGPTECTVFTACHTVGSGADATGPIPIGKPIARTYVRVLTEDLRPTPVGTPGELCVGGDGLALGYVGRPEATAASFVPDPFSPGELLYRTGDLVVERPDGDLEFRGRVDSQVKVRGFRIEPMEIEQALRRHPGVEDAVVVKDGTDDRLVAYLVAGSRQRPDIPELRAFLAQHLPPFMVPSAFLAIERIPLNASGKLDRAAITAIPAKEFDARSQTVPAHGSLEGELLRLWKEVLCTESVGVDSDFFELGGHSIHILGILEAIANTWHVELDVEDFLTEPTVRGLCAKVATLLESR